MSTKRPEILDGQTVSIAVGCGKLYITLNHISDERYTDPPLNELFVETNFKSHGADDIQAYCCKSFLVPIAKLLTFIVRRVEKEDRGSLIKQLHNHECPKKSVVTAKSCVDGIARVLLCYWEGHRFKEGRCYICGQKEGKK